MSWPLAGMIHNVGAGLGQTEQMSARQAVKKHASAIQVGSCVLGNAVERQNWHSTMHKIHP